MHFGKWDAALLEYDVMFSKNFDFVLGGKMPGFYGGRGGCVGGRSRSTCFSTRFMWRKDGDGEVRSKGHSLFLVERNALYGKGKQML